MMRKNAAGQRWTSASLLYGALGVSACTAAQPLAALSQAEVAVRQASESKAPLYTVELSARTELDNARLAMDARGMSRLVVWPASPGGRPKRGRRPRHASNAQIRSTMRPCVMRPRSLIPPPSPPIELRLAKDELDNAKLARRSSRRARHLAEQALADARLADMAGLTLLSRSAWV
jgi:hypothetical protein